MRSFEYRLAPWLFMLPALIFFSIFVVWPIFSSIRLSFYEWDGLSDDMTWVGFGHYIEMFTNDFYFVPALINNVKWLVLFPLAIPIGLGIALFLNQGDIGARISKSLFFFPFVISSVVIGLIFSWFYDPRGGVLSDVLAFFGIAGFAMLENETWVTYGVIIAGLYPQIAYCVILYLTGLTGISPDQIEAGRVDGAKGWKMLRHIVLPQLWPATFLALVVTVIGALRSFDLIAVMTGGGPYGTGSTVLAYRMYEESLFNFRTGYGASLATVLFLIMDIFIIGFLYIMIRDQKNGR